VEPSWTGAAEAADEILDWTAEKLSQAWEAVKSWIDRNAKAIVGGPVGMVIGAALVGGLYSGVVSAQERLGKGQSWSQVFWGSLADATGVGQIHSAITDQDIATGERLGLSQTQKVLNLAFGGLQLFGTVAGIAKIGMAAVRGLATRAGTMGASGGFGAIGLDRIPTGPTSNELKALYLQRASSPLFRAKLWAHNQLARVTGGRVVSPGEITEALVKTEFRQAGLLGSSARQAGGGISLAVRHEADSWLVRSPTTNCCTLGSSSETQA